uniref:MAM domain-containing protein n=1 Tax=Romanomermis culicivorax TaxID=13658 RepID=A0A915JMN1_ROMCU
MGKSEGIQRATLKSPKFPAMARSLSNISSPFYRQCKIRFFYHEMGITWPTMYLRIEPTDYAKPPIDIWRMGERLPGLKNTGWRRESVDLPFMESDYYLRFDAVRFSVSEGNSGLDDISITPQCFIQVENELNAHLLLHLLLD